VVKLGDVMMIVDLHRKGLTVSSIARQTGFDRKTVRKYIALGLSPPVYGPRAPRPRLLDPFEAYLDERLKAHPGLTATRLLRELRERGYRGAYSAVRDHVRMIRPPAPLTFEVRFETPAGQQAQVDFAHFRVVFEDEPSASRVVWLFSMVMGHSRYLWARFVAHQDLQTVIRCHMAAFEALGGVPAEILYDRMKTAVTGPADEGGIAYNAKLLDMAAHYGFVPRACKPYRAKTKGKVERPFGYIRQDFFLAGRFRNLDDLNAQLGRWLAEVANARLHATTRRVVSEAFAEERTALKPLPAGPYRSQTAGRAGPPSARSVPHGIADRPPLPASRSASPPPCPERCAPDDPEPARRRSGSRCLAQSLCYPLPWWLLVSLASSVVSQRQLNQSGSHRPNLRKILYVIDHIFTAQQELRRSSSNIA
jgi:transposase